MGKYGLSFDVIDTNRQFTQLADFMRTNPGSYDRQKHEAWIEEVCLPGLESGSRRALAWWQDGHMIGDAVLKIEDGADRVELKNFRVAGPNELRDKGMGGMLLKFALAESVSLMQERGSISSDATSIQVVLDATQGTPVIGFFERHGFSVNDSKELYTPGVQEVLMSQSVALD